MTYANITIVGNVGNDVELRYLPSGIAVANASVAVNRRWNDSNTGEVREETDWYRVAFWRRTAEVAAQYVKKGDKIMVIGSRLKASAYTTRDGEVAASLELTADRLVLLGSSNSSGEAREGARAGVGGMGDEGEDIPF